MELPEDASKVSPEEWTLTQEDRVYGPIFRKSSTQKFMNTSYWTQAWPYRTTLIKKKGDGNRWMLVELCDKMEDLIDPFGKIPQAKEPGESITLLHIVKIEEPEMVGKVLEMTKMFTEEGKKDDDDDNRDIFKELLEDYEPQGSLESVSKGGGLEEKVEVTSCAWVTWRLVRSAVRKPSRRLQNILDGPRRGQKKRFGKGFANFERKKG